MEIYILFKTFANMHMFQFGHFKQFQSKQADQLQTGFHRRKEKQTNILMPPPSCSQANLHASVALHTISSQVYMGANTTICTSLVN